MIRLKLALMRLKSAHLRRQARALTRECESLEARCGAVLADREVLLQRIAMIEQERGERTRRLVWTR